MINITDFKEKFKFSQTFNKTLYKNSEQIFTRHIQADIETRKCRSRYDTHNKERKAVIKVTDFKEKFKFPQTLNKTVRVFQPCKPADLSHGRFRIWCRQLPVRL